MLEEYLNLPGDPAKLRDAAAGHQAMSEALRAMSSRLDGVDTADLTGSSADALRRKLGELVGGLDAQADQHDSASSQLLDHAGQMDERRSQTVKEIGALAAGIAVATAVGVAVSWLTAGFSALVTVYVDSSAVAAAAALALEFVAWLDSFIGGMGWLYVQAIPQAFAFQATVDGINGVEFLGDKNELKSVFGNALGIALGTKVGGLASGAGASAAASGFAGGAATGLINSTAVVKATGGDIDPKVVAESVAFAGLLGSVGSRVAGPKIPLRPGVVEAPPVEGAGAIADVAPGEVALPDDAVVVAAQPVGGGEFVQPGGALGGGAGDIELVPMPSGGSSSSSSNPGPGSENGVPGPGTSHPSTDPATGSDGPGSIASGGSAGDTPGGGSRADTSAGSTPPGSPTVSNIPDPTTPTTVEAASQPAVASRGAAGAGVPFSALAGTAGSGSSSAPASVSPLYSLSEQDLAGYATA